MGTSAHVTDVLEFLPHPESQVRRVVSLGTPVIAYVLGMMKALKEAGVEGCLAKLISRDPKAGAPAMTMELVKAEKCPVAASMFEIPAGYKKQAGSVGMLPLPQEYQDTLNRAMEKLIPEQRKMLENLRQHKGSGR